MVKANKVNEYLKLLNKLANPEQYDATDDDSSTVAG